MRLLSYNVNGFRSCADKGLMGFLEREDADIVMLQEVKAMKDQVDLSALEAGYHIIWNPAERKGYSGTALFSKAEPVSVAFGLPGFDSNSEGRVITADFGAFIAVCVYTPNSKAELARLDYRQEWDSEFAGYAGALAKSKPVICAGDFNVAHEEIDLAHPESNHLNPGFSDQERSGFSRILEMGFKDSFRLLHPTAREYSWFSYRSAARKRGIGWRIDYFLVSDGVAGKVTESSIINSEFSSDHLPIRLCIALQ